MVKTNKLLSSLKRVVSDQIALDFNLVFYTQQDVTYQKISVKFTWAFKMSKDLIIILSSVLCFKFHQNM